MIVNRHPLVVKLKSGEYNGKDLMDAWLLIESQAREIERLSAKKPDIDFLPSTLVPNPFRVSGGPSHVWVDEWYKK